MAGNQLVKICVIAGFVLAEVYMAFVVLAPTRSGPPPPTRMIIPEAMIPKVEGVAPGTQPPPMVVVTRLAVCAFFFGPFGACVGLGAGLLLDGARRKAASWRGVSRPRP